METVTAVSTHDGAGPFLLARTVRELMTPNPVSIREAATVWEAAELLTDRNYGAVPVINEAGRPVGVLSRTDIVRHERERTRYLPPPQTPGDRELPSGERVPQGFQVEDVDPTRVRDLMNPMIYSVSPEDPVEAAVHRMVGKNVHRLFVVDRQGVLVGVISAIDIVRNLCG